MSALVPQLGALRAIVVVSPHWETAVPTVGFATRPETIHDFGGFDPRLYEMQYPAVGSPEVAAQVFSALQAAGFSVAQDAQRGLDHGAWTPLRQMFPNAEVPVVPMSVQSHLGPEHAYRVGQALAPLAQQGILVLASGNITHNLRDLMAVRMHGGATPAYVQTFADWIHTHMTARDVPGLLAYRQQDAGQRAPRMSTCCRCSPLWARRVPMHSLRHFSGASATTSSPWTGTPFPETLVHLPMLTGCILGLDLIQNECRGLAALALAGAARQQTQNRPFDRWREDGGRLSMRSESSPWRSWVLRRGAHASGHSIDLGAAGPHDADLGASRRRSSGGLYVPVQENLGAHRWQRHR
jgi:4,5-DOPA dioxygenase extradiol